MSWHALASLGVTVRPLAGEPPKPGGQRSPFSASLTSTVKMLATELRALDATRTVVGLDVRDRDIRLDGLPRAGARPASAAVEVAFESRFGPLRYATAEFNHWHDNLRAIALSMEALRRVDRYGVSKRGEQYAGWRAIPMTTGDPADAITTVDDANTILAPWVERDGDLRRAIRAALFETHPDNGGDPIEFRKVTRARELLGVT